MTDLIIGGLLVGVIFLGSFVLVGFIISRFFKAKKRRNFVLGHKQDQDTADV